jgi:hypothetical protein
LESIGSPKPSKLVGIIIINHVETVRSSMIYILWNYLTLSIFRFWFFGIIFLSFLFFWVTFFSPRRGCPRVQKFCMGFKSQRNKIKTGGRAEGQAFIDPVRTPIRASGILLYK